MHIVFFAFVCYFLVHLECFGLTSIEFEELVCIIDREIDISIQPDLF